MHRPYPCLWFDTRAEEAANFYLTVFKKSKINNVVLYGDSGPGPKDSVMVVFFELNGEQFLALNGGSQYPHSPAVSFVVGCDTQEEIDHYWSRLGDGGTELMCGWLTDRFGISWQIVPSKTAEWLSRDAATTERVMVAINTMVKIDLAAMQRAVER